MAVNTFDGSSSSAWNTAANWSLGTVPTVSDGHVTTFDATSPSCSMGGSRSCNNIDFTGYTNTLTMSTNTLAVAGNITLDTGMIISGTGRIEATATGSITSNGFSWPNDFRFSGGVLTTKTLIGDLTINGALLVAGGLINKTTSEILIANNGQTISGSCQGSADIYLKAGTWTATTGNSIIQNNLFLDGGSITISGTVYYGTGTLRYLGGTITTTGSTLRIEIDCTINTSGMVWGTVFVTSSLTLTIDSTLSTDILIPQISTFSGSYGWVCNTFQQLSATSQTVTLKNGITYTINTLFDCKYARVGSIILFTSDHASNKANLVLQPGATCQCLASFTRINNTGRPIRTFNGTVTDCVGVVSVYDLKTVTG